MIPNHQSIHARCRFNEKPPQRSCVTDSCLLRSLGAITQWTLLMGTSPVACLTCAGVSKEPNACAVRLLLTSMTVPGRGSLLNGWIPTSCRNAVSIYTCHLWVAFFSHISANTTTTITTTTTTFIYIKKEIKKNILTLSGADHQGLTFAKTKSTEGLIVFWKMMTSQKNKYKRQFYFVILKSLVHPWGKKTRKTHA